MHAVRGAVRAWSVTDLPRRPDSGPFRIVTDAAVGLGVGTGVGVGVGAGVGVGEGVASGDGSAGAGGGAAATGGDGGSDRTAATPPARGGGVRDSTKSRTTHATSPPTSEAPPTIEVARAAFLMEIPRSVSIGTR